MLPMLRSARTALAVALLSVAAACSSDSTDGGITPPPTPPPPAPKVVATVQISGAPATLAIGFTAPLVATARDSAGAVIAGKTATWQSSSPNAAVSAGGVVTGVALGAATLTATIDGKSATADLTITPAAVAVVSVTPGAVTLMLDEQRTLTAETRDALDHVLTDRTISWSTNAPLVATVDPANGRITAVDGGQATITATSEGKSATVTVTVHVPVATVSIVGALDTLEAYDERDLQAVLKDAKGRVLTGRTIEWTSSNVAVATVPAPLAKLVGVDRGTVTITATSEGKTNTATRVVVIKYRDISAGTMHACDLASGGIAWCWGLNGNEGRIGSDALGDASFSATPVRVPGGLRFSQLSTFGRTTCAVALNGDAYCWGNNGWGILGSGTNVSQSYVPVKVAGGHAFMKVSAGSDHACGIDVAGVAWCWGNNDWRQQGAGTTAASNIPVAVSTTARFLDLKAGPSFACGIIMNGSAMCWGANNIGQVGDGLPITNANVYQALPQLVAGGHTFSSVSVGGSNACALTTQGTTYCWGSNNGKFGNGGNTSTSTPTVAANGLTFRRVSAGFGHTCAVTLTNEAYCWGSNGYGQLGNAAQNGTLVPVRAGGALQFADVSAAGIATGSAGHTCAISKDRLTTWCWGRNDVGQLGNGTTDPSSAFTPTPSIVHTQKPL